MCIFCSFQNTHYINVDFPKIASIMDIVYYVLYAVIYTEIVFPWKPKQPCGHYRFCVMFQGLPHSME